MPATNCENCQTLVVTESKFCPKCGFPQHGIYKEQEAFYDDYNKKQFELNKLIDKAGSSTAIMLLIAVFSFFLTCVGIYLKSTLLSITEGIVTLVFLGLALWSNKNTFAAILVGFVLYTTFVLLSYIILDNYNIIQLIIVIVLGRGCLIGYKINKLRTELKLKE